MSGGDTAPQGPCAFLLSAVARGDSPEEWEGMLRMLWGEGGAGAGEGGALLHSAVREGRLPWVRTLLAQGADPLAEDGGRGTTALQVAAEMKEKHPSDEERRGVLELVRVVASRDGARGQTPPGAATNDGHSPIVWRDAISVIRRLTEAVDNVSAELSKVKVGMEEMDDKMATRFYVLSQEISSTNKEVDELKAANRDSFNRLNTVMTSSKESFETAMKKITSTVDDVKMTISKDFASKRDAIDRMKTESNSSRESLETLKTEIISTVEDVKRSIREELVSDRRSLDRVKTEMALSKESVEAVKKEVTSASLSEWRREQEGSSFRILRKVEAIWMDRVKEESIEALMRATLIHERNESKVARVRSFYDQLYSRGTLTSVLIKFLRFHPTVKVRVDCDNCNIKRLKWKFRNHDGDESDGSGWGAMEDLGEMTVYWGALVDVDSGNTEERVMACLAQSLCIMSALLVFKNKGRPYSAGDRLNERRYADILKEIEEKRRRKGVDVGSEFELALDKRTVLSKSINMIAGVAWRIALDGSSEGTSELRRRQMGSLLEYYEDHVVRTLTGDWESKMASSIN